MVVVGIDPGYAIVGYGVVNARSGRYRPMECGAVTAQVGEVFEDRLVSIYDSMCAVLAHSRPGAVSIERLYFTNNKAITIGVAEARGVVLLTVHKVGAPIFEYASLQVKQAVAGYGQAKEPQVMEVTRKLLCLTELSKPDDTTDALAMAICHGQAAGSPLHRAVLSEGIR